MRSQLCLGRRNVCGGSFFSKISSSSARPGRQTEETTLTSTSTHSRSAYRLVASGLWRPWPLTFLTDHVCLWWNSVLSLSDMWHWNDAPLKHEQFVLWNLVPQEKKGGHVHFQSVQPGGEESLDRRPGEDPVGSGRAQSRLGGCKDTVGCSKRGHRFETQLFQSCACRRGCSWGWAANRSWTFSPAMLPSVTEPWPVPCLGEVSLRIGNEIKYVFRTTIVTVLTEVSLASTNAPSLKVYLSCSCVFTVYLAVFCSLPSFSACELFQLRSSDTVSASLHWISAVV